MTEQVTRQGRTSAAGSSLLVAAVLLLAACGDVAAQVPVAEGSALEYQQAMDDGRYGEAEAAAKLLLGQAIREGRRDDISTAVLLSNLALAQRFNRNFDAALQNYELAISIVESNTDKLDLMLVEPLLGVANTHLDGERPDLALPYLRRALHVQAVNNGPHSLEQAEALEILADAYVAMNRPEEAVDIADRIVILLGRNFSRTSTELVPALLKKGQMLGEAGERREERKAYENALRIVERNHGKLSPGRVRPLIRLGKSYEQEYFESYSADMSEAELPDARLLDKAEAYFESALELARATNDAGWETQSDAMLALGDFYTLTKEEGRARILYGEAWELLTADTQRIKKRRRCLETAVPLLKAAPDLTVAMRSDDDQGSPVVYEPGYVIAQFTVTRRGRLSDIGIVGIQPKRDGNIEAEVIRSLGQAVYRPRFENGFVVDSPSTTIRYEFPYPKRDVLDN